MQKKIVYIGVALLILALIVFLESSSLTNTALQNTTQNITQSLQRSSVTQNVVVQSDSFYVLPLPITNTTAFFLAVGNFSSRVNAYLFNGAGFGAWNSIVSGNTMAIGLNSAIDLEGRGALIIYRNVTFASVPPYIQEANVTPIYMSNASIANVSTYYFVIDNTNGSASSSKQVDVTTKFGSFQSSALSSLSGLQTAFDLGLVFFVLLVAGLLALVLGILRKPKGDAEMPPVGMKLKKDEVNPAYVNRLYRNLRRRGKRAQRRSKRTARKRSAKHRGKR